MRDGSWSMCGGIEIRIYIPPGKSERLRQWALSDIAFQVPNAQAPRNSGTARTAFYSTGPLTTRNIPCGELDANSSAGLESSFDCGLSPRLLLAVELVCQFVQT
jgi:hypothetical protein